MATDYNNINQNRQEIVLIVDGLNLFIRNFQAIPTINHNGEHVGGVLGFFRTLLNALVEYEPDKVVIVFDGKGGSTRRRKILKNYKSKVLSSGTFNRFSDTRGYINENSSQRTQVLTMLTALSLMPVRVISIDNIEADDIISCLVREIISKDSMKVIISSDRDFLQLVDRNTCVYNHDKRTLMTESDVYSIYGYIPLNYLTYRCFTGDRGDNIPGVKQVGDVGLNKHFNLNTRDRYIELDEIFEISEKSLRENQKPKIFKNIIDQKDIAIRNYNLMQLLDVDISNILKSNIKALYDSKLSELNYMQLEKIFFDIELCKDSYDLLIWQKNLKKLKK